MPYMNDGGLTTLRDVLDFYNAGAKPHNGLDPGLKPLGLSRLDLAAIEAFFPQPDNIDDFNTSWRSPLPRSGKSLNDLFYFSTGSHKYCKARVLL